MGHVAFATQGCTDQRCADRADQSLAALEHRDCIGMAKGLLMAARNCSPDDAFDTLRSESSHRNMKLWQVAERIVADHRARTSR